MGEYQETEHKSNDKPVMVGSDDALFDLAESHMPQSPEPFTPPTSRFEPTESHSPAHEELGYSQPFDMPDMVSQRAIVLSGGGNTAMKANVLREQASKRNEDMYNLTGKVEPRTPAQEKAAKEDAEKRFNEAVERRIKNDTSKGVSYEKKHDRAVADVMAQRERLKRP